MNFLPGTKCMTTFQVNVTFLAGTTLLCFQLVNEEVGTEDTSDYV